MVPNPLNARTKAATSFDSSKDADSCFAFLVLPEGVGARRNRDGKEVGAQPLYIGQPQLRNLHQRFF